MGNCKGMTGCAAGKERWQGLGVQAERIRTGYLLLQEHRGDSNEYTIYIIFYIKEITHNFPKSTAMGYFFKGLKNELETAVVYGPSVFEPPKVYCNHVPLMKGF